MPLRLSPDLSLPDEAITETFGILAARGAGKSNTAAVMAEEMFDAGLPFCVIDPVGSWWGLRSNGKGTGPGIPIAIFGGPKGDVPLERGGGQLIADIVVNDRLSCVLDLRSFESEAAKKHFLLDFARRLYTKNEAPLHLFLEEADDYIPQKAFRDEAQLLRAWENIVRRGRARGLGMTLITQRSAVLNKNVLTQVQTLIAMRTTGPQDRKAIEEWLKYNDQSKDILESLPGLGNGEAWVWSPQFLKTTARTQFRRRRTFDSGSTPKMAAKSKTATLADIDVSALRTQMADTIKRAEADDPKRLKKRIAELERQVKAAGPDYPDLRDENAALTRLADDLRAELKSAIQSLEDLSSEAEGCSDHHKENLKRIEDAHDAPAPTQRMATPAKLPQARANGHAKPTVYDGEPMPEGPRRTLIAIAQATTPNVDASYLAAVAGYSTRTITNNMTWLRSRGLVESGWPAKVTAEGLAALGDNFEELPTGSDLLEHWLSVLEEGPRRTLRALSEHRDGLSNPEIAEATNYSTRTVTNNTGALKRRKLIEKRGNKFRAIDELFD